MTCHKHKGETAVEAEGISVRLGGKLVLKSIDLCIHKGEAIALIGPNGAGKTTLLKALLGLLPLETGRVSILGAKSASDVANRIGYVPQRLFADPSFALSVREFLALNQKGVVWPWFSQKKVDLVLEKIAEEIGISGLLSRAVSELSGGQFQRVMIAFALLKEPEILFMDEPTSGVDAPGEESFYAMVGEIHRKRHLTVVLVSHDLSMVYKHASRVYALNREICCQGVPEEILKGENLERIFGQELSCYHHHHCHGEKSIESEERKKGGQEVC